MIRVDIESARALFEGGPRRREAVAGFGPLAWVFRRFVADEDRLDPPDHDTLARLFDRCIDPAADATAIAPALRALSPGNGRIGSRQVNWLVDLLRARVGPAVEARFGPEGPRPHIHAFGSGGDFVKTGHATTSAAIAAAPRITMCKTGTTNVTSRHGSAEAAAELGYGTDRFAASDIDGDLARFGFAFVPLAALGFGYGAALSRCRRGLWEEANARIAASRRRLGSQAEALARTDIPLDIFKIVSPNAQLLRPRWHVTGVCHLSMLPYVLGLFLHLRTRGMILHARDGIDELSNGRGSGGNPRNNLVVEVGEREILISEFSPEEVGIAGCDLDAIEEEPAAAKDVRNLVEVLRGRDRGPRRDFIALNAAALLCEDRPADAPLTEVLRDRLGLVDALLDSGESYRNFEGLLASMRRPTGGPPILGVEPRLCECGN